MFRRRRPGENPTREARAAANEEVPRDKRYVQIIRELMPDRELTAKEIAINMWHRLEIPTAERNFTAPRLTELSEKGVVEPVGKTKCKWTGKTVTVYALTDEYRERVGVCAN